MSQKGRVVNVRWTCRDVSAPDCDVSALPDFFWNLLLEALHTPMCSCLPCNSTSIPLAFLSAAPSKLVPSVPSERRALTNMWMQLEFRPEVGAKGWLLYITWKAQGTKVGETPSGGDPTLSTITVFARQAEETGLPLCFISVGFVRSPLFHFLIDFCDVYFNHTL